MFLYLKKENKHFHCTVKIELIGFAYLMVITACIFFEVKIIVGATVQKINNMKEYIRSHGTLAFCF